MDADDLKRLILERSTDGRITCSESLSIASELGVAPSAVGERLDEMGIRIVNCQLGCFP